MVFSSLTALPRSMRSLSGMAALFFILISTSVLAQQPKTKNIIIVTLDGYRWQELFAGPDHRILFNPKYVKDTTVWNQFAGLSEIDSRAKLMPFFWNVIGAQGQLYGNRRYRNKANCSNRHLLSYPGYSEMLVGFTDPAVTSNRLNVNPNASVLEFIQKQNDFRNRVAAFSTWDAFPYILREEQSGIYINAGADTIAEGDISRQERWLNKNQSVVKNPHGARYDAFTFRYAMEYLRREQPRVMFIGFDETDEHAHGGRYDEYLKSAHQADQMIAELWQWVQSQSEYRDQTTLLITTDHGRGKGRHWWKKHSLLAPGSRQIWFAVLGPDTPAFGEMKTSVKHFQKQMAKTIAAFLGLNFQQPEPIGEVVQTMLAVPDLSFPASTTANSERDNQRNED
jgi:hypothetical protein